MKKRIIICISITIMVAVLAFVIYVIALMQHSSSQLDKLIEEQKTIQPLFDEAIASNDSIVTSDSVDFEKYGRNGQ